MNLSELFTIDNMIEAYYSCRQAAPWKTEVQKFGLNLVGNCIKLQEEILTEKYQTSKPRQFTISERGKLRLIEAPVFKDRIVHRILNKKYLLPILTPYLIHDNGASMPDKGTGFARSRLEKHLHRYYYEHGSDGYILLGDVHHYFDSIRQDILIQQLTNKIPPEDNDIFRLLSYVIYSSKYDEDADGLSLGSELPQTLAVFYLSPLDNFIKIVKGCKFYGRYMDDFYIISDDKQMLNNLAYEINAYLSQAGLMLNDRKTQVVKLSHSFTFLQTKYSLMETGRIVKRLTHSKVVRQRRRMKAHGRLYREGIISYDTCYNQYKSWRQSILKSYNACYTTIKALDDEYKEIYGEEFKL